LGLTRDWSPSKSPFVRVRRRGDHGHPSTRGEAASTWVSSLPHSGGPPSPVRGALLRQPEGLAVLMLELEYRPCCDLKQTPRRPLLHPRSHIPAPPGSKRCRCSPGPRDAGSPPMEPARDPHTEGAAPPRIPLTLARPRVDRQIGAAWTPSGPHAPDRTDKDNSAAHQSSQSAAVPRTRAHEDVRKRSAPPPGPAAGVTMVTGLSREGQSLSSGSLTSGRGFSSGRCKRPCRARVLRARRAAGYGGEFGEGSPAPFPLVRPGPPERPCRRGVAGLLWPSCRLYVPTQHCP
jgi:hypothetical protein